MENQLFQYLRQILYEPEQARIDIAQVPKEDQNLVKGLMYLAECMKEQRSFARGLSKGDLQVSMPASDNPLTGELRALHGAMAHLVWQARQVAKGDYGQNLDFMGELSDVFNKMTVELQDREKRLEKETAIIQKKNDSLKQSQELLIRLTKQMSDWIVIMDKDGKIVYQNQICTSMLKVHIGLREQLMKLSGPNMMTEEDGTKLNMLSICLEGEDELLFEVSSQGISWGEKQCELHILHDITEKLELKALVYRDPLTHLFNRRYGIEYIEQQIEQKNAFQIGFIDIDMLKYVNDELGHKEGDCYICDTVEMLVQLEEPKVLCRIGGDEFLIISVAESNMEECLEHLRERYTRQSSAYEKSFSYGVAKYRGGESVTASQLMSAADEKMYCYKYAHKRQRLK